MATNRAGCQRMRANRPVPSRLATMPTGRHRDIRRRTAEGDQTPRSNHPSGKRHSGLSCPPLGLRRMGGTHFAARSRSPSRSTSKRSMSFSRYLSPSHRPPPKKKSAADPHSPRPVSNTSTDNARHPRPPHGGMPGSLAASRLAARAARPPVRRLPTAGTPRLGCGRRAGMRTADRASGPGNTKQLTRGAVSLMKSPVPRAASPANFRAGNAPGPGTECGSAQSTRAHGAPRTPNAAWRATCRGTP